MITSGFDNQECKLDCAWAVFSFQNYCTTDYESFQMTFDWSKADCIFSSVVRSEIKLAKSKADWLFVRVTGQLDKL